MRNFHSYGPVDCEEHFCVERRELIDRCAKQLVGNLDKGGHYFTIWASRQAGKTWLTRQVAKQITAEYEDKFQIGTMSMQGIIMKDDEPEDNFLSKVPFILRDGFRIRNQKPPENWESFSTLFTLDQGLFDRPVILFIDEFDSLPLHVIDRLVTLFRDMYLKRDQYVLHGLALIGVRAVLGVGRDLLLTSNLRQIKRAKKQSAEYATGLGMNAVTVVVFISDADENILEKISSDEVIEGIRVTVRAIGI
ncbi:MAG: hypothetical protein GY795_42325 [Desulfobacterales bacterium]|nr:hypothetical protein [Desulfobacterales bacterium]